MTDAENSIPSDIAEGSSSLEGISIEAGSDEFASMNLESAMTALRSNARSSTKSKRRIDKIAEEVEQLSEAIRNTIADKSIDFKKLEEELNGILSSASRTYTESKVATETEIGSILADFRSKNETYSLDITNALSKIGDELRTQYDDKLQGASSELDEVIKTAREKLSISAREAESSASSAAGSAAESELQKNRAESAAAESAESLSTLRQGVSDFFEDAESDRHIPTLHKKMEEALSQFSHQVWGENGDSGITRQALDRIEQLERSNKRATELIESLTDASVHGAFKKREISADRRHTVYQIGLVLCVISILGVGHPLVTDQLTLESALSRSIFLLPLTYLLWVINRTIKIEKRLAEAYRHKASTMDALTGYRNLYKLKHDDAEYLKIFDNIQSEIIDNPGRNIEKLLTSRLDDGSSGGWGIPYFRGTRGKEKAGD